MRIKLDVSAITTINLFERVTGAKVRDCITGETRVVFVVEEGEIGRAIGRNGVNIKKIEQALNRKIKIVEFNPDVARFVGNLVLPLRASKITVDGDTVVLHSDDVTTKGLLIGRNAQNLRHNETIVKRYFDIREIKVM